MQEKVYLNIFILCTILSSGILAKFLKEDVGESSNLLVRAKRVINRSIADVVTQEEIAHVVNLKKNNKLHCVGSILSHHTVITAARCVSLDISLYTVLSGSEYTNGGTVHNVIGRKMHSHSPTVATFLTGIALITVNPPFVYSSTTRNINLHVGPVLAGTEGIVSGWATHVIKQRRVETSHVRKLRSIIVPIMNHRECHNFYRNNFSITDEYFCTLHSQKQCGNTDAGAPFVSGNQLVGVHIGAIYASTSEFPVKPDVFLLVQQLHFGRWIRENIVY